MDVEFYRAMRDIQADHWWYRARRRIVADRIRALPRPARPLEILEAGCGTGGNLPMLAEFGHVRAFEVDAFALDVARGFGVGEVARGALPDAVPFGGPFDLIVALDVIEHLDDDAAGVGALARLLAPGGWMILTVPAFAFLWSELDDHAHHRRRYERSQLRAVLTGAGLAVERETFINAHLFPAIVGVRAVRRLLGLVDFRDEAMPGALVNRLCFWAFDAERLALRWIDYPFGVSLLAVGRRR